MFAPWLPVAAQAVDYTATAAVGGQKSSGGTFGVVCSTPSCFSASFDTAPGGVADVTGTVDAGGFLYAGWAQAWASSLTTLHAGSGLDVSGVSTGAEHLWFANAMSAVDAVYDLTPLRPEDLGLSTDLVLHYALDGTATATGSGDIVLTSFGRVFASVPGQQAVECLPDPGLPGHCTITVTGFAYGDSIDYTVTLQTVSSVATAPGEALPYTAAVAADFRHTQTLAGASVFDAKSGAALQGWALSVPDEGLVLFTSPVPEPATWALMIVGVSGLLARRRYST